MTLTNILLVEDSEQNIKDAQDVLGNLKVAKSLAQFEEHLSQEKPDCVLSDLYFPTGYNNEKHERIKAESAVMVEDYISQCQRINSNPIGTALEQIFKAKGITSIDEYFELFKDDPIVKQYKDHIRHSYDNFEQVKSYKKLAEEMRNDFHQLPSGIFVYRRCLEEKIPVVIVTSAYHHGIEFQPFVNHVGTYVDTAVDNKKDWKKALEYINRGK